MLAQDHANHANNRRLIVGQDDTNVSAGLCWCGHRTDWVLQCPTAIPMYIER